MEGACSIEVIENAFDARLVSDAARAFPSAGWGGWLRYESPFERKLASREMPDECRSVVDRMQKLHGPLQPDASLHGGGMHAMGRGGILDLHLDCDRHPQTGRRRARNAILFLNPAWAEWWGGALEFWDADRCVERVYPRFNRLVIFDTTDESYHGIPEPLTCPQNVLRMSLAVYFWGEVLETAKRPRAMFVPRPGETWPAEKLSAARDRAGL